jgi:hypothetical protein
VQWAMDEHRRLKILIVVAAAVFLGFAIIGLWFPYEDPDATGEWEVYTPDI